MKKIKEFWAKASKKQKALIIGGSVVVLGAGGLVIYRLTGKNVLAVNQVLEDNSEAALDALEAASNVSEI